MAKVLEMFPGDGIVKPEWLDGQVWQLDEGEDFNCTKDSIRGRFSSACYQKELRAKTRVDGDSVIVQARPRAEEKKK
jgi:hypothetical protein